MSKIVPFPEKSAPRENRTEPVRTGELVAMRGVRLDLTLETVAFLRTLSDQTFLDRFNRVQTS